MGPPSYMRSIVDWNVVMRRIPEYSFLHSPVTSTLSTMLFNILSLQSSLSLRDPVSHPNNNSKNYSSVYLNIYIFI
jgi:hypothetical protein